MQDISLFLGRFHPLIVHIPIGIILFAFALELYEIFTKVSYKKAIVLAYVLTAVSGSTAAFAGYLLSSSGGYDEVTLGWHKWLGILTSVLALALVLIKSNNSIDRSMGKTTVSQIGLLLSLVLISVTGHLGGKMTHGDTYLTEYMPSPLKQIFHSNNEQPKISTIPAVVDSVIMYTHIIEPFLKATCQECHNTSKMKGELDLTSIEGIAQGGLSGHAIESGKLKKSELYKRVTLSRESKKYMPPNNKTGLTNVELDLLKIWIENGASFDMKFHEQNPDEKESYLVSVYLGISTDDQNKEVLPEITEIDEQLLEELISDGLMVDYIAENSALIDVSFVNVANEQVRNLLDKLSGISMNIYKVNLSNSGLTDDDLAPIKSMANLSFLRLENNKLTGATLENLVPLKQLSYLNLNGNPLNDSAKDALKQLEFVNKIYLWQTSLEGS